MVGVHVSRLWPRCAQASACQPIGGIDYGMNPGGAGWATFGGFDISTDHTRKVWRLPS